MEQFADLAVKVGKIKQCHSVVQVKSWSVQVSFSYYLYKTIFPSRRERDRILYVSVHVLILRRLGQTIHWENMALKQDCCIREFTHNS